MPKLPKKTADAVADAKDEYALLPDDIYTVKLVDVKVSEKEGGSGYHYWTWELAVVGGEYENRKLWFTTSLSPQSSWVMKQAFDAFGYTPDSDTDEMLGDQCKAVVTHRVIDQGKRAGQTANQVDQLLPLNGTEEYDDEVI